MVLLAASLYPTQEANRERTREREGAMYRLGPRHAEALLAKNGGLVSPDANSTLRVTYGKVLGVAAKDGLLYAPQTTLAGVVEKATGQGEFNAPKAELDAIKALRAGKTSPYVDRKLNDVPVNFLSTVDTTGGNSGSATLNARGELCGLLFDGTFDTVASDYIYDTVRTRSIHVDSRYMLWTMSEVDGATNLLREIGEAPEPRRRSAGHALTESAGPQPDHAHVALPAGSRLRPRRSRRSARRGLRPAGGPCAGKGHDERPERLGGSPDRDGRRLQRPPLRRRRGRLDRRREPVRLTAGSSAGRRTAGGRGATSRA